jgi:hypothetical protein
MRRAWPGGTRFKAPSPKPAPADPFTCAGCGSAPRLGEERTRLEREARAGTEAGAGDRLESR